MAKACEEQEEDSEAKDDKTITAVGLLSTIESILGVMEGKLEVLPELEKLVLPVIYAIIQNGMIGTRSFISGIYSTLELNDLDLDLWPLTLTFRSLRGALLADRHPHLTTDQRQHVEHPLLAL